MKTLSPRVWLPLSEAHRARVDALTAAYRERRSAGERHAIEDFLFDYYSLRPTQLRRWHPGPDVGIAPEEGATPEHAGWRWYSFDDEGVVRLDVDAFLADRGDSVRFIQRLLSAIEAKDAFTGCFGLHEWAMVYQETEHRHQLPLRLGQAGTDAVVESHPIRCTHFDAFRFFTEPARGLNREQPTREQQAELEQPGCLHAGMDCLKWATKLGPAVPGDLLLDCFELARDIRLLDMQASPYDLSAYGQTPVKIETAEGKAVYARRQRQFAQRSSAPRARLLAICDILLAFPHKD